MKKTFKTLLALLLALTLVCALFVPVWAGDASDEDTDPTDAPTEEPTEEPTDEPTDEPTQAEDPTQADDPSGGEEPTEEPTDAPTEAAGPESLSGGEIGVKPPAEGTKPADPSKADEFKMDWEENIAFIKDYGQWYDLGTLTLGECALVKCYILNEDGTLYASNINMKHHHDEVVTIQWKGLDMNGCHPAGSWNNPAVCRFSITIIATDIDGYDHYFGAWFTYKFYDNDRPAAAAAANGANGGKANGDVPHTGL